MAVMNVITLPNELLHKVSSKVDVFDKSLKKLVDDMFETMYKNNGIGLAGVQVGVLKQIIVIDINYEGQVFKSEVINPKIVSFSNEKSIMEEGCLSVSGRTCKVNRPVEVAVEYQTVDGEKHKIEAKGLIAKCFQHEIDHLKGITIVDREEGKVL